MAIVRVLVKLPTIFPDRYLNFGHDSVKPREKKPELQLHEVGTHDVGLHVFTVHEASVLTVLQHELG
tara:strand:- start:5568 stop:5768 length:201 start_codon:yes stop_codon:yes gene_type:complete